jgi:hypothetical protein
MCCKQVFCHADETLLLRERVAIMAEELASLRDAAACSGQERAAPAEAAERAAADDLHIQVYAASGSAHVCA